MSVNPANDPQNPSTTGDHIQVGDMTDVKAVAIGAGATAIYHGLTVAEVTTLMIELKQADQPVVWNGRYPYIGLNAFQERDAEFFFGRESLVEELLARLDSEQNEGGNRFITISGPSGSGKSSVVRAGLFYALREARLERSDSWLLATMQPRGNPIAELGVALSRPTDSARAEAYILKQGMDNPLALHEQVERLLDDDRRRRFVLLVDQFEETFTQTKDVAMRAAFIKLLTTAAEVENGRVTIILALRSDFISHCASHPDLRRLMSQQFQLVGAMEAADLAKAIALPALKVGAEIDPALVSRILADMKGEPGALPLMSFALQDLFKAEESKKGQPMDLTLPEYTTRGGIEKALERHANAAFAKFTEEEQGLAKGIFSKLIEVGQGRVDTRRSASFSELIPAGADADAVRHIISTLAQERVRLITTRDAGAATELSKSAAETSTAQSTVTIAHEKLIDAWPWLRQLVDENRDMIILQNQISADAQEWMQKEDDSYLYRGGQLIQVEEQLTSSTPDLNKLSQQFIQASLDQRQREIEGKEAQQRRELEQAQELAKAEQKRSTLFRRALIVGSVLALFLVAAMIWAGIQTNNANGNLGIATAALIVAETANADAIFQRNEAATSESNALAGEATALAAGTAEAEALVTSEAAVVEAIASEARALEQAQLAEARAFAAQAEIAIENNDIISAYLLAIRAVDNYESDGSPAREAEVALAKVLINLPYRAALIGHTGLVTSAVFNFDGSRILTTSQDTTARLWEGDGTFIIALEGHMGPVTSAVFNPNGSRILTASEDGTARLWNEDGTFIVTLEGHISSITSAVFNSDGSRILTASEDGTARLWDKDGTFIVTLEEPMSPITSAVFNPDGSRILTASEGGTAQLWDADGTFITALEGHTGSVTSDIWNRDSSRILTTSEDGTTWLWDGNGIFITVLEGYTGSATSAIFNPDDSRILTYDSSYALNEDKTARLWDEDGTFIAALEGHTRQVLSAIINHDGNRIATLDGRGTVRLWDRDGTFITILEDGTGAGFASVTFNQNGDGILTTNFYGGTQLWDGDGTFITAFWNSGDQVTSVTFNYNSSRIITTQFNKAWLWDGDGPFITTLDGDIYSGDVAAFNLDGSQIATASKDGTAQLWDRDGSFIMNLEEYPSWINSFVANIEFILNSASIPNYDNSRFLTTTGSNKETGAVFDLDSNVTYLLGHTSRINSIAFNNDSSRIITASQDGTVRLWDGDGRFIAVFEGHTASINSAAFSPDGSRIITASEDGTARLWEVYSSVKVMRAEAMRRLLPLLREDECLEYFDTVTCQPDS